MHPLLCRYCDQPVSLYFDESTGRFIQTDTCPACLAEEDRWEYEATLGPDMMDTFGGRTFALDPFARCKDKCYYHGGATPLKYVL